MDGNNWRPAVQGEANGMDGNDWRSQLSADARQKIVNKIMETLKKHLPVSGPEGLVELQKIAVRFEEKIYTAATSQSDYLRKISMKMLTMENKSQPGPNSMLPTNANAPDQGLHLLQQQRNPGQPLPIPLPNQSQSRQQLVPQNLQNTATQNSQNSAGLPSALSSIPGSSQNAISNVGSQGSNLQAMAGISSNSMTNSVGQGVQSHILFNSQRQMPGRPQQVTQQHQQQPQNSPQLMYQQQQLQHQLSKQKMQQGNMQSNLLPSHMQPLLQPNHMQPSQQSLMSSSNLSSAQPTQQTQLPMMQSSQPGIQQNQQSSVQQSGSSVLQQQSVLRQQQQAPIAPQSILPSQQQQQLTGQQSNSANMQQNQLHGQQNSISDLSQQQQRLLGQQNTLTNNQQQQQQLLGQQNNISSLQQQQQLGPQSNVSGLQQPQQQQLLGSGLSNIQQHQHQLHLTQHSKVPAPQQQAQQASSTFLPSQGQQTQSQPPQQQLMSQLQTQQPQLPQQLQLQQQPSSLQREIQQRMQTPGALIPPQNSIDQHKQLFQSQRGLPDGPSSSVDSTAQTGHTGVGDWQEEVYQKIKSMKESYFPELNEVYQKINLKLQQHDALVQQPKQSDQLDKLRMFKTMLERTIAFLQMNKHSITMNIRDKLPAYEKQILGLLNPNRVKKPGMPPQQGQQPLPVGQSQQMMQQSQSQITQLQQHENHLNQMQSMNLQPSMASMQTPAATGVPHASVPLSTHLGVQTAQQNMMNALQPSSNLDSTAGNTMNSMIGSLQHNPMGLQQNTVNTSQQANINTLSQTGSSALQPNMSHLQQSSNLLHHPHMKQEQIMQTHQMKQQYQQRQFIQQQQQQKQQQLQQQQQQQLQQQQKPPQSMQFQQHQMPQLHQMNEANDLKVRPGSGIKPVTFSQHHPSGQRPAYQQHQQQQQLKMSSMNSMPIPSPQFFQAQSPQISQHSSPQIDQQSLLNSVPKSGTPLQSASSPFIVPPSPSTPLAPSPLPGDSEKQQPSGISSISNAGNLGHQQGGLMQSQSLAIGTPGISPSPLLAEFSSPDGNQCGSSTILPSKTNATEKPLERLIKVVKSMSPNALSSAVSDIGSVVSMVDRIASSAPSNGSRAAVGEDLVAMTKCRLQARNFMSQDGTAATKKMKRHTSAMPLNAVSSVGSVNDSFKHLDGLEMSELESTATSRIKRHGVEVNHALLEEIRDINLRLIDTVVEISDEDVESASTESEGTIVKCSYNAVALSPNLKSPNTSTEMSPILPLRLLVPATYPSCSPILMDKLPVELSNEFEDLSVKARLKFNISLRCLSQPMALGEMARTWDVCVRDVVTEYAQQNGGGCFSSRYGTWAKCVNA